MSAVAFRALWKKHPFGTAPCDSSFVNQCAVRMGIALEASGVDTSSFDSKFLNGNTKKGTRCWFSHSPRHILRAQELALWLNTKPELFGEPQKYTTPVTNEQFRGRTGIIFIKDGWERGGDHIDVWNGRKLKGGRLSWFALGKEVWFWEID